MLRALGSYPVLPAMVPISGLLDTERHGAVHEIRWNPFVYGNLVQARSVAWGFKGVYRFREFQTRGFKTVCSVQLGSLMQQS